MTAKMLYIDTCEDCSHMLEDTDIGKGYCVQSEKEITDTETIPDWCELENYPKGKDNDKNTQDPKSKS